MMFAAKSITQVKCTMCLFVTMHTTTANTYLSCVIPTSVMSAASALASATIRKHMHCLIILRTIVWKVLVVCVENAEQMRPSAKAETWNLIWIGGDLFVAVGMHLPHEFSAAVWSKVRGRSATKHRHTRYPDHPEKFTCIQYSAECRWPLSRSLMC